MYIFSHADGSLKFWDASAGWLISFASVFRFIPCYSCGFEVVE